MQVRRLEGHTQTARVAVFSRDGSRILSGGPDCTVRVWDAASGKELERFKHTKFITNSNTLRPGPPALVLRLASRRHTSSLHADVPR